METVKIVDEREREDFIRVIDEIIVCARHLNFPNKVREGSLKRIMHGTNFLHGMLKKKVITNELYQQLVKLAEDPELEYNIVI